MKPEEIKVGMLLVPKEVIHFCDCTSHVPWIYTKVTEQDLSYFKLYASQYSEYNPKGE